VKVSKIENPATLSGDGVSNVFAALEAIAYFLTLYRIKLTMATAKPRDESHESI
jgi:hypothetical protein